MGLRAGSASTPGSVSHQVRMTRVRTARAPFRPGSRWGIRAWVCLQDPAGQGYVGVAVADVAAAGVEAHHRLHLQSVLARLLEQLDVCRKVVLLRTLRDYTQPRLK